MLGIVALVIHEPTIHLGVFSIVRHNLLLNFFFIFSLIGVTATANIPDEVTVEVPSSPITRSSEEIVPTVRTVEFQGSSFAYFKFEVPAWSPEATEFKATMPLIGLHYVSTKAKNSFVFGFAFSGFERQSEVSVAGPIYKEKQTAYLGRLRLGYRRDLWKSVYAGVAALPTTIMVNESPVGRSQNLSFLPYQISFGATYSYLAAEAFYENLNGTNDSGFSAGVRIPL